MPIASSTALACATIGLLRPGREDWPLGLALDRSGWRWTVQGIIAAVAFAGTVSFLFRDHTFPSQETIAYEATMPGLAEELCWRGLVFVFLGRAYTRRDGACNLVPAAIVSIVLFGLWHGINVDKGSMEFAWLPFAFASVFGTGLAVLRLIARSIASRVVTHNLANVFSDLVNALP